MISYVEVVLMLLPIPFVVWAVASIAASRAVARERKRLMAAEVTRHEAEDSRTTAA